MLRFALQHLPVFLTDVRIILHINNSLVKYFLFNKNKALFLFLHFSAKTEGGEFCKIPYDYQGKAYHDCTTEGDPKSWCRPADDKWGYCTAAPCLYSLIF